MATSCSPLALESVAFSSVVSRENPGVSPKPELSVSTPSEFTSLVSSVKLVESENPSSESLGPSRVLSSKPPESEYPMASIGSGPRVSSSKPPESAYPIPSIGFASRVSSAKPTESENPDWLFSVLLAVPPEVSS